MATKKKVSPAYKATAILVLATIASRCRAGIMFSKDAEKRVELADLPEGALAAIEADPYLKVSYEADELVDDGANSAAESRILELETNLADKETELAAANARIVNLEQLNATSDKLLDECKVQLQELTNAVEAKDAELAELKAATSKAKK